MTKQPWLDAAEVFDAWRVVPRTVLYGYCLWVAHVTDSALKWYQSIPAAERGMESAGLVGAIITAVTGMAVWVFRIYSDSGRDWTVSPKTTQTITSTTEMTK